MGINALRDSVCLWGSRYKRLRTQLDTSDMSCSILALKIQRSYIIGSDIDHREEFSGLDGKKGPCPQPTKGW